MQVSTEVVPRRFLLRLLETACAKWLVPLLRCIALPLAERRNRFFGTLVGFNFGFALCLGHPYSLTVSRERSYVGMKIAENSVVNHDWEVLMGGIRNRSSQSPSR